MKTLTITAGEYIVSRDRDEALQTFLGSCVGIGLYDKRKGIGALGHIVLPEGSRKKEFLSPGTFARSAIPMLLNEMEVLGASPSDTTAFIAGGASIRNKKANGLDLRIGQRNIHAVRKYLIKESIPIVFEDCGQDYGRTMTLFMNTGHVTVRPSMSNTSPEEDSTPSGAGPIDPDVFKQHIDDLVPVSGYALRALRLANDKGITFSELERLILKDQVLTANLLKIANSAYYGLPRQITRLSQILSLLGLNGFKRILLESIVYSAFSTTRHAYSTEQGALFEHALGCARLSEVLARRCGLNHEDAYVAGLLHDLGKVVIERCAKDRFALVMDRVSREEYAYFADAEREIIGIDHATLGGMVLVKWGLPQMLSEAVAFHHQPYFGSEAPKAVALVHLSNHICHLLGIGVGVDTLKNPVDARAVELLGIRHETIEDIIGDVKQIVRLSTN